MAEKKAHKKTGNQLLGKVSIKKKIPHILLAEDNHDMRTLLAMSLRKNGYEVTEFADGHLMLDFYFSADSIQKEAAFDLIISDIRMPFLTGVEILEGLHGCEGFPPMILITAFGDEETHKQAYMLGAAAILDKPFDIDELIAKVQEIAPSY
ncbi:MAG: response regulator [Deltaproteobacteria bacterium HGW-Deltaproteobacteria-13]|jgi:DNA-binding response OmpR family regulator|nr:MAG: response regulator [Deltaproteobacteria bacterium HGW-Deltaproteobacteria-13]